MSCRRRGKRPLGRAKASCCVGVGIVSVILIGCGGGAWVVVSLRQKRSVCGACVRELQGGSASACRPLTYLCAGGLASVSGRVCCVRRVNDLAFALFWRLCLSSGRAAGPSSAPSSFLLICRLSCRLSTCGAACPGSGVCGDRSICPVASPASLLEAFYTALVIRLARACYRLLLARHLSACGPLSGLLGGLWASVLVIDSSIGEA